MNKLISSRKRIEKIDKKIAKLFEKRMLSVNEVYEYKKTNNIDTYDEKRESFLLEKNSQYIKNKDLIIYYQEFQKSVMNISKEYQNKRKNSN